ncbi:MAG: hypothetical protein ACFCBU_03495 [Cyanophyceae cyanobacterium]
MALKRIEPIDELSLLMKEMREEPRATQLAKKGKPPEQYSGDIPAIGRGGRLVVKAGNCDRLGRTINYATKIP